MSKRVKLIIGTIIFISLITGLTVYNDYKLNHCSKTGKIIENNIQEPDFDKVFTKSNTK